MILIELATARCVVLLLHIQSYYWTYQEKETKIAVPFQCLILIPSHERQCIWRQRPLGCLLKRLFGIKTNQRSTLLAHFVWNPSVIGGYIPETGPYCVMRFDVITLSKPNYINICIIHLFRYENTSGPYLPNHTWTKASWLYETRVNAVAMAPETVID